MPCIKKANNLYEQEKFTLKVSRLG